MASVPVPTSVLVFCSCVILASILLSGDVGVVPGVCASVIPDCSKRMVAAANANARQRLGGTGVGMVSACAVDGNGFVPPARNDIVVIRAISDGFCIDNDYGL